MFKPRRLLQTSLRDLFWLGFVAAIFILWGMDHWRLAERLDALEKPATLPSPYSGFDSVQYFPPGPEFPISNEAAAQKAYKAEEEARLR